MGKTVTHAAQFRDPFQPDLGPDRLKFVLACDDGSIYEFQRMDDIPLWNLRSRGERSKDPHFWTTSRAPLPADVKETLDETVGENYWEK